MLKIISTSSSTSSSSFFFFFLKKSLAKRVSTFHLFLASGETVKTKKKGEKVSSKNRYKLKEIIFHISFARLSLTKLTNWAC